MALMKWESLKDIEDVFDRTARAIGWPQGRGAGIALHADWNPRVDISESDSAFLIRGDIPGVAKEDLKVSVEHGVLTLQGERRQEQEENNQRFHRVERSYGSFLRSFTLPENVDITGLKARINDGQLEVTIPKTLATPPSQPVQVPVE